ncbi:uncharacterized protein B0H18DRAFT_1124968 [Fomitopsis serialis]|uniref:uncharacterized protein n=1 Tax=Fomitopsis serialis TaxID=139415 RepID=UPI0020085A6F|nr:uncharacterized protein B0H18DRAFT_1124968 [Neoantrodia serialis]KAH9915310.1 hypothetical protein B0H18DRAFT_1124968 [Neoantrodia serialis]
MQFKNLGLLVAVILPFLTVAVANPAPAIGSYYYMDYEEDVPASQPTARAI